MIDPWQSNTRPCHCFHLVVILILGSVLLAACGGTATPTVTPSPTVEGPGQIAFTAGRANAREIFTMKVDGSDVINLTNDEADDWYPAWSWDRWRIAFVSDRDGNKEIYWLDVGSKAVNRLTWHVADDCCPAWSPDSTQIAFTSKRGGNPEIYLLGLGIESEGLTPLTDNPASDTHPSWSPDGERIAFASDRDGNWEIYVMDASGGQLVNMTNAKYNDWQPAWSPDSTRIAFASDRDGNREIYVMDVVNKEVTRLTTNQRADWSPSWARDGRHIVFLGGSTEEKASIYRMNVDGTGEKRLTYQPVAEITPAPNQAPPSDTPEPTNTPELSSDAPTREPTNTPKPPIVTLTLTPTPTRKAPPPPPSSAYFVVYTHCPASDLQNCSIWGMRDGDRNSAYKIVDHASEPILSPDGQLLAFHRKDGGIYVWNFAKSSHQEVVQNGKATFATWSPTGEQLAYYLEQSVRQIHIVNVGSLDFETLTPGMRPSWSPKGDFIAYDSCDGTRCGLFRISPQGGNLSQITSDGGASAAVSPDGKKIAYRVSVAGGNEIFVVNADGTTSRQLTSGGGNNVQPTWSPDGAHIFYLSDRGGQGWAVMKMTANGENKTLVVEVDGVSDLWQHQRISVTWYDGEIHAPQ